MLTVSGTAYAVPSDKFLRTIWHRVRQAVPAPLDGQNFIRKQLSRIPKIVLREWSTTNSNQLAGRFILTRSASVAQMLLNGQSLSKIS